LFFLVRATAPPLAFFFCQGTFSTGFAVPLYSTAFARLFSSRAFSIHSTPFFSSKSYFPCGRPQHPSFPIAPIARLGCRCLIASFELIFCVCRFFVLDASFASLSECTPPRFEDFCFPQARLDFSPCEIPLPPRGWLFSAPIGVLVVFLSFTLLTINSFYAAVGWILPPSKRFRPSGTSPHFTPLNSPLAFFLMVSPFCPRGRGFFFRWLGDRGARLTPHFFPFRVPGFAPRYRFLWFVPSAQF